MRFTTLYELYGEWDCIEFVPVAEPTENETHAVVDHTLTGTVAYGTKDELLFHFGPALR